MKMLRGKSEIRLGLVVQKITEEKQKRHDEKFKKLMTMKTMRESVHKKRNNSKVDAVSKIEEIENSQMFKPQYGINVSIQREDSI